jgi:hypothetical protein
MRHFPFTALCATALCACAIVLLGSAAQAREQQELRERVRDGVQRTDKDLGNLVHRDKLNAQQRDHFDATLKDLRELGEAVTNGKWEGERERLERAVDNMDFVVKQAPMDDGDRQTLGIDLYTLRVILDSWKP